ncbi:glucose-6-phosphate isomerase [uncultured Clostridium sp.]|uniref:glucose-6-phosphate isomerase n=1 Tax=uncultured Clostridium sp. TaxID=59620 RepID=UPI003216CC77
MTSSLSLNIKNLQEAVNESHINNLKPMITAAHNTLHNRSGAGNEFLGWLDLPTNYDKVEFERVKVAAKKIQENSKVLIVIGIGGSYIGARAVIEAMTGPFFNSMDEDKRKVPAVYFAGNNISSTYLSQLIQLIDGKDFAINVISKSGTTTEPAIAFRIFKEIIEKKYGKEEAKNRIFITTDKAKGALKKLADTEGYETFIIPDDIGGRFSVLTPVGLLPIAVAGINIDELLQGARNGRENFSNEDVHINICYKYAAARHLLYERGKTTEILVNYEPCLQYFGEWFKQLYGESQGKDGKGIFPASVNFSTDLHSMGQYIQDGMRNIFETIINVEEPQINLSIKEDEENVDGLNFLAGKTIDFVNKRAMEGTVLAHVEGGVPNIVINMKAVNPKALGELIYFFEKSCAIGGYLLGINPFDQEGVEAYKKNMFALLGKPGYEKLQRSLIERLGI